MITKILKNSPIIDISFRKEEEWECLESFTSTLLGKEYIPMSILGGKDGFILTFSDGKYNSKSQDNDKKYEVLLFMRFIHKENYGLITNRYEFSTWTAYLNTYQELLKILKVRGYEIKKDLTNLYKLI